MVKQAARNAIKKKGAVKKKKKKKKKTVTKAKQKKEQNRGVVEEAADTGGCIKSEEFTLRISEIHALRSKRDLQCMLRLSKIEERLKISTKQIPHSPRLYSSSQCFFMCFFRSGIRNSGFLRLTSVSLLTILLLLLGSLDFLFLGCFLFLLLVLVLVLLSPSISSDRILLSCTVFKYCWKLIISCFCSHLRSALRFHFANQLGFAFLAASTQKPASAFIFR